LKPNDSHATETTTRHLSADEIYRGKAQKSAGDSWFITRLPGGARPPSRSFDNIFIFARSSSTCCWI